MRSLAVVPASLFVAATGWAALALIVIALAPLENVSSDRLNELDLLAVAGSVLLLLAVATIRFVWTCRPVWAALSYGAYAVVGLSVLLFVLTEMSDHGDNQLLALAFFTGVAGLVGVVASFSDRGQVPRCL